MMYNLILEPRRAPYISMQEHINNHISYEDNRIVKKAAFESVIAIPDIMNYILSFLDIRARNYIRSIICYFTEEQLLTHKIDFKSANLQKVHKVYIDESYSKEFDEKFDESYGKEFNDSFLLGEDFIFLHHDDILLHGGDALLTNRFRNENDSCDPDFLRNELLSTIQKIE